MLAKQSRIILRHAVPGFVAKHHIAWLSAGVHQLTDLLQLPVDTAPACICFSYSTMHSVNLLPQIESLDREVVWARSLEGQEYMPGLVGLNNMKNNDYVNVAVQILARVVPIRNYFLDASNYSSSKSVLVKRFGELLRKIWNPRNFKGQVLPNQSVYTDPVWL